MNRRIALRLVLAAVGLAIGVVAVVALREATLSTHDERAAPDSRIEVVVAGRTRHSERSQTLDEMVHAQLQSCRLEVSSDIVGPIEAQGDGRFRAVLKPTMDQTDRRQFRGCLEDWRIDNLQLDVIRLAVVADRSD